MEPVFVLVHSPLVGPFTWYPVKLQLQRRRRRVIVPKLRDDPRSRSPYWWQHAGSVTTAIDSLRDVQSVVLVGHSGAGALLPAIRDLAGRKVSGYIFVDAGIPTDGESRLGPRDRPTPFAEQLLPVLEAGGTFPNWTDEDLAPLIPDARLRHHLLAELHRGGLDFWTEPIPVFNGWPDAPPAFLHFSAAYDDAASRAQAEGWTYEKLAGGHFHMLVEPGAVAAALVSLYERATGNACAH